MSNTNYAAAMRFSKTIFVMISFLLCLATKNDASTLSGNLKQGQYSVGFKVIHTFDYSRAYRGKQGRPMQVPRLYWRR